MQKETSSIILDDTSSMQEETSSIQNVEEEDTYKKIDGVDTYKVVNRTNYFNLDEYISFDKEGITSVEMTNVNLSGKSHKLYYKNFVSNYDLCMNDNNNKYDSLYLDDKLLFNQSTDMCYLSKIMFIKIIDNKYIAAIYRVQGLDMLLLFDSNGNRIDDYRAVEFLYENGEILVKNYEENDKKFIINTYSYNYNNGSRKVSLLKKGTESYCDSHDSVGYCPGD